MDETDFRSVRFLFFHITIVCGFSEATYYNIWALVVLYVAGSASYCSKKGDSDFQIE